jgi:hypothetical protein
MPGGQGGRVRGDHGIGDGTTIGMLKQNLGPAKKIGSA